MMSQKRKTSQIAAFAFFVVLCLVAGRQAAAQQGVYRYIDLSGAANMAFADELADDEKGGAFDQGPTNDFRQFPVGEVSLGVPFKIIDAKAGQPSVIVLRGKPRPYFPLETKFIPVGERLDVIEFLGMCGWGAGVGESTLRLVVQYADQRLYDETNFDFGVHIGPWWRPDDLKMADVVWRGESGSAEVGMYRFAWVNPHPESAIASIRLISENTGAVPAIFAATGIRPSAEATERKQELAQRQLRAGGPVIPEDAVEVSVQWDQVVREIPPQAISYASGRTIGESYGRAASAVFNIGEHRPIYRFQTHLAEPSPAEGVWDFAKLDAIVDYAIANGAEPMLCISGRTPWMTWRESPYGRNPRRWRPDDIEEFADYCAAIVRYYNVERGLGLRYWEVKNEPELKGWSYNYYLQVYQAAARKMRDVDPTIKIGGPVTAGSNLGWARELLQRAGDQVDFISYHQYGYSTPFDTPSHIAMQRTERFTDAVLRYRDVIRDEAPGRDMPLFITEANTNPTFANGTDPRIRTMFGGAWYASSALRFIQGGGDVFCFFTFDGGFGMTWARQGEQQLYPTYHTSALLRKYFLGQMVRTRSGHDFVEAYAFANETNKGVILVNKLEHAVPVQLDAQANSQAEVDYVILNETSLAAYSSMALEGGQPRFVPAISAELEAGEQPTFVMQPYEVRAVLLKESSK